MNNALPERRLSAFAHRAHRRSSPQSSSTSPHRSGAHLRLRLKGWPYLVVLIGALSLGALCVASEQAHALCSVLSRHPCTPYVGSVLRRHPFTPYSCGVFGGPCSPQVVLMFGELPVLRIAGHAGPSDPIDRDHRLDRLDDIAHTLSKCLELPPDDSSHAGMEVALKLAFKRDGELMSDPRFTYTTHEAPENVKAAYHAAVLDMLKHCTPLPVTKGLGGAIAGRPLILAIKDTRGLPSDGRRGDAAPPARQGDAANAGAPPGDPQP